jgi:hypothetical protein
MHAAATTSVQERTHAMAMMVWLEQTGLEMHRVAHGLQEGHA